MPDYYAAPPIPRDFIWRKAHSLTGVWLVLFLIEHLLTNSQAALYLGDNGAGFIHSVNWLKDLPYLQVIEIFLLGVPFLIHGIWGVRYLFTGKYNSFHTDGSKPSLGQYSRNQAYTWQRITSWILLVGVIAHVIHMRFMEYPSSAQLKDTKYFMLPVSLDNGLYTLAERLDFKMYDENEIQKFKRDLPVKLENSGNSPEELIHAQSVQQNEAFAQALEKRSLEDNQILAVSPSFGVIELLLVRDTFKSPLMIFLYTGLVLATCFHAFNGLWTSMISWGITLTEASQRLMRKMAVFLMVLITFLGLAAIWGTYWFNLYH